MHVSTGKPLRADLTRPWRLKIPSLIQAACEGDTAVDFLDLPAEFLIGSIRIRLDFLEPSINKGNAPRKGHLTTDNGIN